MILPDGLLEYIIGYGYKARVYDDVQAVAFDNESEHEYIDVKLLNKDGDKWKITGNFARRGSFSEYFFDDEALVKNIHEIMETYCYPLPKFYNVE